ncbi:MAG: hypothetical protein Q7V19_17310, partial [Bacteroidales bacterium]|nr:hypothetical protein [Bacteroidales bacterium]
MQNTSGIMKQRGLALSLAAVFLLLSGFGRTTEAVNPIDSLSVVSKRLQAGPNQTVKTLDYYSELVNKLSNQPHDTSLLALVYNQLGGNYYMHARYDQALKSAHMALRLYLNASDTSGLYKLYHNMGIIYEANRDYEQAWKYLMLAHDMVIRRLESNPTDAEAMRIRPGLYNNMGIVCDNRGMDELAMQYYEKALAFSNDMHDETVMLTAGLNIGILYGKTGNYPLALQYIQSAYDLAIRNKEHY